MRKSAGVLCAFLGIILLIGGYVAFWYELSGGDALGWVAYPYRYLAIPLIVLGVVLIKLAGVFLYFYTPKGTP